FERSCHSFCENSVGPELAPCPSFEGRHPSSGWIGPDRFAARGPGPKREVARWYLAAGSVDKAESRPAKLPVRMERIDGSSLRRSWQDMTGGKKSPSCERLRRRYRQSWDLGREGPVL